MGSTTPGEAAPLADLYEALLARRSVRRFENREVPEETRRRIVEYALRVEPLVAANTYHFSVLPIVGRSEELSVVMGGYGRLVSARHLVLPRLKGPEHVLLDFGFRTQQLVIHLTRLGLASCWIAALGHEAEALERFDGKPGERIPAVVIFGYPATKPASRGFDRAIRTAVGADRQMPFDRFAYEGEYGRPARLHPLQEKVMDALRRAPSAGNSRPWRVVMRDGRAHLCVRLDTAYYRMAKAVRLGYHLLDAGIGMANVSLAMKVFGCESDWSLEPGDDARSRLGLPDTVQPLASIAFPAG